MKSDSGEGFFSIIVAGSTLRSTSPAQPAMPGAQNSPKRTSGMSQRAPPPSDLSLLLGVRKVEQASSIPGLRPLKGSPPNRSLSAAQSLLLLQGTLRPMSGKFLVKGTL